MSIKNTVLLTLTATAWLAADAAAQRNRGAALPEVSCPGANANDEARTAQEALNRSVISQGSR